MERRWRKEVVAVNEEVVVADARELRYTVIF